MVNDRECSDTKVISEEVHRFLSKLYSSSYSVGDSLYFFESITIQYIPQIDWAFKELCDSEISMKDLDTAIKQTSGGKAPGEDGLTSSIYKFF